MNRITYEGKQYEIPPKTIEVLKAEDACNAFHATHEEAYRAKFDYLKTVLTDEQIEFIKENHEERVDEYMHDAIDRALICYSDIEDYVRQFSNITDVLRGEYTMENLFDDVWQEIYEEEFFL